MSSLFRASLREHQEVISSLEGLEQDLNFLCERLALTLRGGNKVMIAGNGGSASDAQHFAAELTGGFEIAGRRGLAAIALTTDSSALTSIANDFGFDKIFTRQLEALGRPGDLFIGISTSGNSDNILDAVQYANQNQIEAFALTGKGGGQLNSLLCDRNIVVDSRSTARIQEAHILIIHHLCDYLDRLFFEEAP